jgi:hypothetical protein
MKATSQPCSLIKDIRLVCMVGHVLRSVMSRILLFAVPIQAGAHTVEVRENTYSTVNNSAIL